MKRTAVGAGLLVALLAVAALAVGGVGATTQANDGDRNASFGAEVSSFMQASSAEAEGEVDDGMFEAGLNRTEGDEEARQALIERRQERLQQRQERLAERRAGISADNGTDVRDVALATHVTVGADRLERSANGTARAAEAAGLNTEALNEIRTNARELGGPEVAELARNVTQRGPPENVPGGDRANAEASRGNGSESPAASGPPAGEDRANASSDSNASEAPGNGPGAGESEAGDGQGNAQSDGEEAPGADEAPGRDD